jgi:hypothetical protein
MFLISIIILLNFQFNLISSTNTNSLFDLNEIENYKYVFEITNEPIREHELSSSYVSLKSIHGQIYECNLTEIFKVLNDDSNVDHDNNEKNGYNFTFIKNELDSYLSKLNEANTCITRVSRFKSSFIVTP